MRDDRDWEERVAKYYAAKAFLPWTPTKPVSQAVKDKERKAALKLAKEILQKEKDKTK